MGAHKKKSRLITHHSLKLNHYISLSLSLSFSFSIKISNELIGEISRVSKFQLKIFNPTLKTINMFFKVLLLTLLAALANGRVATDELYHSAEKLNGPILRNRALLENIGSDKYTPEEEKNPEFWINLAHQELLDGLKKQKLNKNKAKNVIFFLGDGMSLSTITAARILKGQKQGHTGEEESLSFERFPYTGLSKVSLPTFFLLLNQK